MIYSIDKYLKKNTAPYIRELLYVLCIDLIIVLLLCFIFLIPNWSSVSDVRGIVLALACIILIYITVELFFNYRLGLLAIIDKYKGDYREYEGIITDYIVESSASGWLWNSIIPKLYPKQLGVNRFRILFISNGAEEFTRIIMSRDKGIQIYNMLMQNKNSRVRLIVCKRSKILLSIESSHSQQANGKGGAYKFIDINNTFL